MSSSGSFYWSQDTGRESGPVQGVTVKWAGGTPLFVPGEALACLMFTLLIYLGGMGY